MRFELVTRLSDTELLAKVRRLARDERRSTAALVAHLGEIEDRRLYLEVGCRSLFTYCTQVLHLSEHAAYNRIEVARAARRFPAVLAYLARGDLHLTAVKLLSALFTPENHQTILAAATHKSKHELEELIARLRPQPDVPAQIRRLPAVKREDALNDAQPAVQLDIVALRRADTDMAASQLEDSGLVVVSRSGSQFSPPEDAVQPVPASSSRASTSSAPARVVALAPGRYKVQFTADAPTYDKLRRAQELLRHRIPNGDLAQIVGLALDRLVRDLEKHKFGKTDRPRRGRPTKRRRSRYIPVAVKRAVWLRDGGRCTFTDSSGTRCTERGQIEFDHRWPHADGGGASEDNVRLLCRSHNQYEAWRYFGAWPAASAPHG